MEGDTEEQRPSSTDANMTQVHAPDRLHLENNAIKNWKVFKQHWITYTILADVNKLPTMKQQALFMNCLGDNALDAYNSFQMKEDPSVNDIVQAFDECIIGKTNETYERLNFNKGLEKQDENFKHFYSNFKRMIKTSNYCNQCEKLILKDEIVLGINDPVMQKDLLKVNNLTLEKCIDICKANQNVKLQKDIIKKNRSTK